jgi:hypothetical protein
MSVLKVNQIQTANGVIMANLNSSGANVGIQLASNLAPAFSAYGSAGTSVPDATYTKITYDVEDFDTNGNFASSRFTPTVAGYYQINASSRFGSMSASQCIFLIYKNGGAYIRGASSSISSGFVYPSVSGLVYCNGTSDYIEIYGYQNSGSTQSTDYTGPYKFNGFLARSA